METTLTKTTKSALILTFVFSLFFLTTADHARSQTMTICPYKIVLNAQGQTESIQAVIPMVLEDGYTYDGCTATLSIGGQIIAESYGAKYCYIDDNLLIYFDRSTVLDSEALADMANSFQIAEVEGTLAMVNTDNDLIYRPFGAQDEVEIVDPDNKGQ